MSTTKIFCLLGICIFIASCRDQTDTTAHAPQAPSQPFATQVQALRNTQQLEQQMQEMEAARRQQMENAGM